jgi:hypothetical protein
MLRQNFGFESRHPSKIIGDMQWSGQHTLACQKNIQKNVCRDSILKIICEVRGHDTGQHGTGYRYRLNKMSKMEKRFYNADSDLVLIQSSYIFV